MPISKQTRDSIAATDACLTAIRSLAGEPELQEPAQLEPLLLEFAEEGNDRAISRLLQVSAFNGVRLDPKVLCRCLGVCEGMLDSAPCFALQDSHAVAHLLAVALDEELSSERQLYASRLAAELTGKFDLDPQPVRKVLWKQEHAMLSPDYRFLIRQSLDMLEEDPELPLIPFWTDFELKDVIPEHKPKSVIGGHYTVRRAVAKLGRNEPCHCGSGKKYKRCCYAKDQELLRDASEFAGTTRSELKTNPGLVDAPEVIYDMRAYELKKLKPSELGLKQLFAGFRSAQQYGLLELAFDMLVEWERRADPETFDKGHYEDLVEAVLSVGDLTLAEKIRAHCGEDAWYYPEAVRFRFDLLENPERFDLLEQNCRPSIVGDEGQEYEYDQPLIRLAYDFSARYPALAIVFARAAIASYPDRALDNEALLDVIADARVDLDLEPWGDPAEASIERNQPISQPRPGKQSESKAMRQLLKQLEDTRNDLEEKKGALCNMEQIVQTLSDQLDKARETRFQDTPSSERSTPASEDAEREATLRRLRQQVQNLKAEIGQQQDARRRLRKSLNDERKKLAALQSQNDPAEQTPTEQQSPGVEPSGKLCVPEYSVDFRRRCEALPASLASKAILTAGRFAAHDGSIWRQTKPIRRLPEHYRLRISVDYRMILRWQPGCALQILDVIPRQDLESWIKRHM